MVVFILHMLSSFLSTLAHYLQLVGLPPQYVWLGPFIMFFFSIALLFAGKRTWRVMTAAIGAVLGYELFSIYVLPDPAVTSLFTQYGIPSQLIVFIVIILSALLFGWAVEGAIVLAIGYAGYYLANYMAPYTLPYITPYYHFAPTYLWVTVAIITGLVAIVLYRHITMYIAASLGTIGIWYTMVNIGLSTQNAMYIAILLLAAGLYYQTHKHRITKKLEKATHA